MADLFQDFAKVKILLISSYEELLKAGRITEKQFEAVLEVLDSIDQLSTGEIKERLQAIFLPERGE